MTTPRDKILRMAGEAGLVDSRGSCALVGGADLTPFLASFAALVAAAERAARIAAQTEVVDLKERLVRSGVERRRAVREAMAAEREACATIARRTCAAGKTGFDDGYNQAAIDIEKAIRDRGAP